FCHGALGSKESAQPLASYWASHGYVAVQPTFGDSISLLSPEERARAGSLVALVNSPRIRREWDDRPMDVKRVLDALDELEAEVDGLAGKIDATRIGMAGHSFGAQTCMLLGGATVAQGQLKRFDSLEDARPRAIIAISPQGPGGIFTEDSFAGLKIGRA